LPIPDPRRLVNGGLSKEDFMNGLHDFVAGGYPLPWNVISMAGLSDFVNGGFPLPQTPVYFPSSQGSLPKAPPMPKALINLGRHDMIRGFSGMGERSDMIRGFSGGVDGRSDMIRGFSGVGDCGCSGSGGGCGGLGAIAGCATCSASMTTDTLIPQASLPAFLQGDAYIAGYPTVYLAGAVVLGLVLFMGSKRGRR
jgi:hypothetical protein